MSKVKYIYIYIYLTTELQILHLSDFKVGGGIETSLGRSGKFNLKMEFNGS